MAMTQHSSAHWFHEPLTDVSGGLRLLLIVGVLVMLTFIVVAWFCSHTPNSSVGDYWQSPIVSQVPEFQTPLKQPTQATPPAPPIRTPLPNP